MPFYRLKPKVILTNGMPMYPNDEYEKVKLSCPLRPELFGNCEKWNNGEGSAECIRCSFACWEPIAEIERCKDGQQ